MQKNTQGFANFPFTLFVLWGLMSIGWGCQKATPPEAEAGTTGQWYRPVDQPVFTSSHQNNHDPMLLVDTTEEYPYHLIISGWGCKDTEDSLPQTFLWRSKTCSWSSEDWELLADDYRIACYYEYDDAIKVGDTYYVYEEGEVYTYQGALAAGSGKWELVGTFPKHLADDVGVFYEDGLFHLFGEYGTFPHGYDGTSLSHLTSPTGTGNWTLHDTLAVNPNLDGNPTYGVGDPTLIKIGQTYYLYCDIESEDQPYRITTWKTTSLYEPFESLGVAISPREGRTADWDNYRIQDGDILYLPDSNRYVMFCNMMDTDGIPGGDFPKLKQATRVVGALYAEPWEE